MKIRKSDSYSALVPKLKSMGFTLERDPKGLLLSVDCQAGIFRFETLSGVKQFIEQFNSLAR
jgi:hypothetical protein